MNEAPLPTQSVESRSLGPPSRRESRARAQTPSKLRTSLAACSAEGLAAEVSGACLSGAVLTAWGVLLDASPLVLGVLWGLPHVGQVFQLPASWVTTRFGRKRVAVYMQALARQVTVPIAVLPFVDISLAAKRAVLVGLFALSSLLLVIALNAWLAWMGDLVPARVRGAYFGRRTALCTVAGTISALSVGWALDAGRYRSALGIVLAAILLARSAAGVATTVLMLRQHDPARPDGEASPSCQRPRLVLRDVALPLANRGYRRLLAYRAAWGIATGLTASLAAMLTLSAFGLGFVGVALYATIIAVLRALTTPSWGRVLDRFGGRHVLVLCSLGAALSSFAWLGATMGAAWLIAIDAVVCGLMLGGQELAVFTLPLSAASREERPAFAAASVMVGGVAYGLASLAGGALTTSISIRVLLLLSAGSRVVATILAARLDLRA